MKDNRKSKDSRNRKTIIRYKNRHPCLDRRRPGSLLLLLILLLLRLGLRELCVCILQCTHVCFHTHIFTQMFPPPHPHALVMLPYTHMHIMYSRPASVVGLFQLYIRSLLPLSLQPWYQVSFSCISGLSCLRLFSLCTRSPLPQNKVSFNTCGPRHSMVTWHHLASQAQQQVSFTSILGLFCLNIRSLFVYLSAAQHHLAIESTF